MPEMPGYLWLLSSRDSGISGISSGKSGIAEPFGSGKGTAESNRIERFDSIRSLSENPSNPRDKGCKGCPLVLNLSFGKNLGARGRRRIKRRSTERLGCSSLLLRSRII